MLAERIFRLQQALMKGDEIVEATETGAAGHFHYPGPVIAEKLVYETGHARAGRCFSHGTRHVSDPVVVFKGCNPIQVIEGPGKSVSP